MQIPSSSRIAAASCWLLAGALAPSFTAQVHAQIAGWADTDIGSPSPPGSAAESAGVLTVRGGGADIWGASDAFHFATQTWAGDGDFVVRVASVDNTNGYAKAGIMFRDGTGADAVNVLLAFTPQGLVQLQHRGAAGADTTFDANVWRDARWLKLTRRGNVFTAYYDAYGSSWTQLGGAITVAMASSVAVGLAVTSHNDGVVCAATFDHVTPPGAPPPTPPARPTGLTANLAANGRIHLEWTDNSNNESRFQIYRTSGYSYQPPPTSPVTEYPHYIGTVEANVHSFDDTWNSTVDDAVYYWVRAMTDNPVPSNPPVFSDYSNIADVTIPSWLIRNQELGGATPAGTATFDGTQYTVTGGGAGFAGTADSGHIYTRSAYFSAAILTARVTSLTSADPAAMAGLMIRGYDSGSGTVANALVYATPGGTVGFQYRHATSEATQTVATAAATLPVYLRLTRAGIHFTAEYSTDGSAWSTLGSAFVNVFSDYVEGFAVASHRDGTLATATFDAFSGRPAIFYPAHWPTPGPPTNLVGMVLSGTRVQLVWDTPQDSETCFTVERSTDGANFTVVASNSATGRTFDPQRSAIDATVTAGTRYYYRIRCANPSGYSTASNTISVVPDAALNLPPTPTDVRAIGTGIATEMQVDWYPIGSSATQIEIQRSADGTSFASVGTVSGSAFQFNDTGLQPATRYFYRIRAVNTASASAYSHVVEGWSNTDATAPATPTDLTATVISAAQVDLRWTDHATNETTYAVQRRIDGGSYWDTLTNTLGANATSYTDRTTTATRTYTYRVLAWNSSETSGYSNEAIVTTPAFPPSGPPAWQSRDIGTVGAAGSDSASGATATVTGSGADIWSSSDAFHFRCEQFVGDGTFTARVASLTDTSGWAKAGLMFRESLAPSSRHAMMIVSVAHGSAFQVRATTSGATTTSTEVDNIGPPRWLRLVRAGNVFTGYDSLDGVIWTQRGTATLANAPTTLYAGFAVTSHNQGVLTTAQFDNVALTGTSAPPPPAPPTAPSNLAAAVRSSARVDLTWQDNSADETAFVVERSPDNFTFGALVTLGANVTSYVDTSVSAFTRYYYRVYARHDAVASGYSNVVTVTTPTTTPPPATPTNLAATAVSASRVDLTWTDNSTDETVFQVERSTDNSQFSPVGGVGPNLTQFSDTTAAPATTYYYRIYARNNELVSGYSNVASVTTPAGPPPTTTSADIGTTTAGSTSESGGRVTLTGSGRDIWNDADGFRYRYQAWTGDGEIVAQVTSLTNTNGWAKAALMFREAIAPTSRHVSMIASMEHGTALQYRLVTGGESGSSAPSENGGPPRWLRLVRAGSTFTGYVSSDGVTWTSAGSISVNLAASLYVGLAVTSHNDGVSCTATFENVSLRGPSAPPPTTPPNPPTNLVATAGSSSQINLGWSDNSTNETGFEIHRSTDGANFSRIFTTGANVTAYSDTGLSPSTTYYYKVYAVSNGIVSNPTSIVSATTQPGTAPPPALNWQSSDVGEVGATGSASESGGTVTLTGSGADIWNAADEFRFRYVTWTGNGEITARVTSLADTNGWAKTGLMFRESLASNARHAAMFVSVAHGTAFQYRAATGGDSSTSAPSESGGVPRWLRLVRNGNTFTGYASLDGVNWTAAGAITLALPTTVSVGLAVTSHNDGTLCTATFTDVTVRSDAAPGSVAAPDNLTASVASLSEVDLAWRDNSANETGFRLERSTDGVNFTSLTVVGADQVHYRDSGLNSSTTYRYRVRAEAGGIFSSYSNTVSITTGSAPPPPPPTWFHGDIGSVGVAGSDDADTATSSITVRGSGSDIWDSADAFHFVYRALTGDCLVEARIASLENTNGWAKVGVMIRESTAANARNVFACLTPAQGVFAQSRASTGGATTIAAGPPAARAPYWVRLARTGGTIVASSSPDGMSWSAIATINVDLGSTVQVGFAVTAHDNTRLNTAVFAEPFTR